MSGTISFSGLASGVDTSGWVDALVSVKQETVTSLQKKQEEQERLLGIVNNIKSYFTSFQSCLAKITDAQYGITSMDLFLQNLALSSNSNIATATATTEAARQSYDVAVDKLATATKATSGYSQYEVKTATLDTTFGTLGGTNGTVTVNQQSFILTTDDTLRTIIQKFNDVGVSAKFDEDKGLFTIGVSVSEIDEGATNLKSALRLRDNNVAGATSGSLCYATRETEFSKLGLTAGKVMIEGAEHIISKVGDNYTITKSGGTTQNLNTIGDFLDYLKSSAVNAEDALIDNYGNISIKGATLDAVDGGSNIIDILNLEESLDRKVMESRKLSYIEVRAADLNTKLSQLGITANTTLTIAGTTHTITSDKTLGDIKTLLAAGGADLTIDKNGLLTINTTGNEISGTLLDVLGLEGTMNGSSITSSVHNAKYAADTNTLLSDLGINNSHKYVAYKSNGAAVSIEAANHANKTIGDLINELKAVGLDASFNDTTHRIEIKDGYIEGTLADALGMSKDTKSYTEAANGETKLEKLGATGNQTLTIDGGAAKTYSKDTTLETVLNDIRAAGGKVEFKNGEVKIQGVTLGGTLPTLLGLDATTQGTSVTSGVLSVVVDSTATGSDMTETVKYTVSLTSKIGEITGTDANYTLSIDGVSQTYTKDSTIADLKAQIEGAGGTFVINDDSTITVADVTLSGTLVGALGFDAVDEGTRFSTVDPIFYTGTSNVATGSTSLSDLGLTTPAARTMRMARAAAPAMSGKTLEIDHDTENTITYGASTTLDDIFADIQAMGGTAYINDEGHIVIEGVHVEGTLVDALNLVETSWRSTITSGNLEVVESTTSTSSSVLMAEKEGDIDWNSTLGSITGDTRNYDLAINGGAAATYTKDSKLSDIKSAIEAAGGTMVINSDNTITIDGVSLTGSVVSALGLTTIGVDTTITSNTPIYALGAEKEADATTKFDTLNIASDKRDYEIFMHDGTVIKGTSSDGSAGASTIGDWLNVLNAQ